MPFHAGIVAVLRKPGRRLLDVIIMQLESLCALMDSIEVGECLPHLPDDRDLEELLFGLLLQFLGLERFLAAGYIELVEREYCNVVIPHLALWVGLARLLPPGVLLGLIMVMVMSSTFLLRAHLLLHDLFFQICGR